MLAAARKRRTVKLLQGTDERDLQHDGAQPFERSTLQNCAGGEMVMLEMIAAISDTSQPGELIELMKEAVPSEAPLSACLCRHSGVRRGGETAIN